MKIVKVLKSDSSPPHHWKINLSHTSDNLQTMTNKIDQKHDIS
jgi:hypothetical protein